MLFFINDAQPPADNRVIEIPVINITRTFFIICHRLMMDGLWEKKQADGKVCAHKLMDLSVLQGASTQAHSIKYCVDLLDKCVGLVD